MTTLKFKSICEEASIHYYEFTPESNTSGVPERLVRHVEQCDHCQSEINKLIIIKVLDKEGEETDVLTADYAENMTRNLTFHFSYLNKPVDCKVVKLFFPAMAIKDLEIRVPTPITAHFDHCDKCCKDLKKIKSLNLDDKQFKQLTQLIAGEIIEDPLAFDDNTLGVLRKIIDREDSGITTYFEYNESTHNETMSPHNDVYKQWDAVVQYSDKSKEVAHAPVDEFSAHKTKQKASPFVRLVKYAAVAAVLLIGFNMFTATKAEGSDLGQIFEAVKEKIRNVYIAKFMPDEAEPREEKWISRSLDQYINRFGEVIVSWDLLNNIMKSKNIHDDTIKTTTIINNNSIAGLLKGNFGLLPFENISDVPEDAEFIQITNEQIKSVVPGTTVYELKWSGKSQIEENVLLHKWRYYMDPETKLPQRIECYYKDSSNKEYQFDRYKTVTYLSDDEFREIVEAKGF